MSKLKKPKGIKHTQASAPESQIKISSFFQKNTIAATKTSGNVTQNATVKKQHVSPHFPRSSSNQRRTDKISPFHTPENRFLSSTQNSQIDNDPDYCIIPDTPENSIISGSSRISEDVLCSSFKKKNIVTTSSIRESTVLVNSSVAVKRRSKNILSNVAGDTDQSVHKRSSYFTVPSSKRNDSKRTPRKSSNDYNESSAHELLNKDNYREVELNGKLLSKQPSCEKLGSKQNKNLSGNSHNAPIDFNSDAALQKVLKEITEFNNLDISDHQKINRDKSQELSSARNKTIVSDSQLIADFSPINVNDSVVLSRESSNKLVLCGNVRRRLTDPMQPDRRPLKQLKNVETLIADKLDASISEFDLDAVLQSTLKELSEIKHSDISSNHGTTSANFIGQRDIFDVKVSQLIAKPTNDNVVNCSKAITSRASNGISSQAMDRLLAGSVSIDALEDTDNVLVTQSLKPTLHVEDSDEILETSSTVCINRGIEGNLQNLLVAQMSLPQRNPSSQTKTLVLEEMGPLPDNKHEDLTRELVNKYKPAFHEFGRHTVTAISKFPRETVLELRAVSDDRSVQASLSGFWQDTYVTVDDTVNVIGTFDLDSVCRITDNDNFIIVNPDLLVSGTTIVSTMRCMRRSVLGQKFKGSDPGNDAMLYGNILHSIFQQVLVERAATQAQVLSIVERVLTQSEFLHEMYAKEMREKNVRGEILKYSPEIESFVKSHLRRNDFKPPIGNHKDNSSKAGLPMFIVNVADVEENIWSPRFGIKGKIDLTVEVKLLNERKQWTSSVVPLELKTGKATFSCEHKGQVMLYTMMSEDRRPRSSSAGLLLYLKDLSMQLINDSHAQKRGLIQLRNEFAHYVRQSQMFMPRVEQIEDGLDSNWTFGSLPSPINDEFSCSKCPQLLNCSLYQSRLESYQLRFPHVMLRLVPESIAHLQTAHLDFFSLWCQMLHLEMLSSNAQEGVSGLWMSTGQESELLSKCLSQLEIIASECHEIECGKFAQVFKPATGHRRNRRLCDVGLAVGSSLIVSAENKPYISLTTGLVTSISEASVTLITDRDLRLYPDHKETVYRLDSCDTYNSMSTSLNNLSRLMENTTVCEKLRRLVIERRAPEFQLTLSKVTINKVKDVFKLLNKPQKAVILKIMMCSDYVLIKGFPGTGKTSTIVALVRILTLLGQSVLLASYTHSAVDNILLKLKQANVDFIRVGRLERVHPELHRYTAERLTKSVTTVDQLDELYRSKSVVATTCLAMNHAIFARRRFDVCIIDEATQVLLPACLSSLFAADRFVLVGDPKQLPPIVHNKQAKALGMDRSLFTHLEDAGGTFSLTLQYRMNGEIMRLSNMLTYDGALLCASTAVAEARLKISPRSDGVDYTHDWLRRCASSREGDEVLWLDTDSVKRPEEQERAPDGEKLSIDLQSSMEAEIVRSIIQELILGGVAADDIGVITPYRQQVLLLRQTINTDKTAQRDDASGDSSLTGHVEINTVDQYQGRDKSVIIVSFVKSRNSHASEILKDVRRLNVAITRAKHKLIFVGSIVTLSSYEYLQNLITKILAPIQIIALT